MENQLFSLQIPNTSKKRIVIIGGGFAGLNFIKKLKKHTYQIVFFDKHNYNVFQPMLYQVATAGIEAEAITSPYRKLLHGDSDVHFRMVKVLAIDSEQNQVKTVLGKLEYDYLIIANGMKANFFGNKAIESKSFPLKFIPEALNLRSHLLQSLEMASLTDNKIVQSKLLSIVIVGGGPTGVELAGTLTELKRFIIPKDYPAVNIALMKIYIVEGSNRVLPPMSEKSSEAAKIFLEKMGVTILLNTLVKEYDGENVILSDSSILRTNTLIWSAGVQGDLIKGFKLEWTERGRIIVDEYHKVVGSNNIFAIGDIAMMKTKNFPNGHPGVAQVAIQSGVNLASNFNKMNEGLPSNIFNYKNLGTLAVIGKNKAVGDLFWNIHVKGWIAWLMWMVVHLLNLKGTKNKIIALTNWSWNYLTYERGNRLIIRGYAKNDDKKTNKFLKVNET